MNKSTVLQVLALITISGCANKQIYDNIQKNIHHECQKLPPAAYQECINKSTDNYKSYTRKRDVLLEKH